MRTPTRFEYEVGVRGEVSVPMDPPAPPAGNGGAVFSDHASGVLKDYSTRSRLFRTTFGRLMASREARAYRRLAGVDGVPRLLQRVPPDGIVLEWIDAEPAREVGDRLGPSFFEALRALLVRLRDRGVLHGDVKRNVLVTRDGRPMLVDFGASFVVPRWWGLLGRRVLATGALFDDRAVSKLKREVAPGSLDREDERRLREPLPFESMVKTGERFLQGIAGRIGRR